MEGEVVSSGETWVINSSPSGHNGLYTINFVCNGVSCTGIGFVFTTNFKIDFTGIGIVYNLNVSGGWTNEAYRTVTFETSPTGDLLTWLQANAVKQ